MAKRHLAHPVPRLGRCGFVLLRRGFDFGTGGLQPGDRLIHRLFEPLRDEVERECRMLLPVHHVVTLRAIRDYSAVIDTLIRDLVPNLLISQPVLLLEENLRIVKTACQLQPVPRLLVWWGHQTTVEEFKERCDYPSAVSYLDLPCQVVDLGRKLKNCWPDVVSKPINLRFMTVVRVSRPSA